MIDIIALLKKLMGLKKTFKRCVKMWIELREKDKEPKKKFRKLISV